MNDDPLLQLIARLPQAESDAARSERVKVRCRAALVRERRPTQRRRPRASDLWLFAAGVSALYVAETMWMALRLYGIV